MLVDKVNNDIDQGEEIPSHISHFLASARLSATWGRFLQAVLDDPEQTEKLRGALSVQLAKAPGRDPLDVLVRDHLEPAAYYYRVSLSDAYIYYCELCRIADARPVERADVEARIVASFPDAVRRFAPLPVGVHFSYLSLVKGKGADSGL